MKDRMMISRIGKQLPGRRFWMNQSGLGLLEVLVCVVLLSGGLVLVYQPLLRSYSVLYDAENRVIANRLSHNRIWEFKEEMVRTGKLPVTQGCEILTYKDKAFEFYLGATALGKNDDFYRLDTKTAWSLGTKKKNILRSVYATTF